MDRSPDVKPIASGAPLKPPALRKRDRIHLCAPSFPAAREKLHDGSACLRKAGYRVLHAANLSEAHGYLAGSDARRAAQLNSVLADPGLQAIMAARGGYGALRLLDRLDWPALARAPKILVGYSDFTAILLAAYQQTGLVGFHGPMAAVELAGPEAQFALHALRRAVAPEPLGLMPAPGAVALRPGSGSGPLLGGCLSLLAHMAGTGFLPSFDGAVLFWEEIAEPPYRIDRMLTQLRLGGHLSKLAAMVVGNLSNCLPEEGKPSLALEQVLLDVLDGTDYPVLLGLPFGHVPRPLTLPVGVQARVEAGEQGGRLIVEEAATRSPLPPRARGRG